MSSATDIRCYPYGERAVVLECLGPITLANQQRLWVIAEQLRNDPSIETAILGMNNLTLFLPAGTMAPDDYLPQLSRCWDNARQRQEARSRLVEIPVRYGGNHGPDLHAVAEHTGLAPEQIIKTHTETTYTVYFLGFLPGFAYLGGLPPRLATPRRAEPRINVPAGSVAIGGSQTGIYPLSAPGGWQIIGRTESRCFDPEANPPTLLQAGDRVRFQVVETE